MGKSLFPKAQEKINKIKKTVKLKSESARDHANNLKQSIKHGVRTYKKTNPKLGFKTRAKIAVVEAKHKHKSGKLKLKALNYYKRHQDAVDFEASHLAKNPKGKGVFPSTRKKYDKAKKRYDKWQAHKKT